jgi:N-terminal acetyltransferase 2
MASTTILRLARLPQAQLRSYEPFLARVPLVSARQALPRALARPALLEFSARLHSLPTTSQRLSQRSPFFSSTRLASTEAPTADRYGDIPKDASFSERLKHLIKKYGFYALGVYLVIGALDFGVAFAGIHLIGADKVSAATATVKHAVMGWIGQAPAPIEEGAEKAEEAAKEEHKGGRDGLYAMAILAWTVHKTLFLPVRVGVTAAVTPKLVGFLRARGWVGSAGARQAGREMKQKAQEMRDRAKRKQVE